MNKVHAFDYLLKLLHEWYQEVNPKGDFCESHSKLSILKLLFLVSVPQNNESEDLLDTFNHFYALPYGPVESDIYNSIRNKEIPSYTITDRSVRKNELITSLPYDIADFQSVKEAVDKLKQKNKDLISLDAFGLVGITHKWNSWRSAFDFAKFMGIYSYEMTSESIREDRNKFFGM